MFKLGMDISASSCQIILTDEKGTVLWRDSFLHHNKVRNIISGVLPEIRKISGNASVLLSVCGTMSHLLGLPSEYGCNEITALTQSVS